MIRELAENPNLHQPISPGRELVADPDGRYVVYLGAGHSAHSATVQRVRLEAAEVEDAVTEIRALLRARGRGGTEWELGESCTPPDIVERLLSLGIVRDDDPVAIGMTLRVADAPPEPQGTSARRVASVDELVLAHRIQQEAFGGDGDEVGRDQAESDFAREGVDGSTFLAFVDGEPVAAGYASYTPLGLILFGGATLPSARGQARTAPSSQHARARRPPAGRRSS